MPYTYRRTWRSEVAHSAAHLLMAYLLAAVLVFVASYFQDGNMPRTVIAAIVGFNTLIVGHHIYSTVKLKQDFACSITATHFKCSCPDPHSGESFEIVIADLSTIEINNGRVSLHLQNGSEHRLTSSFGNPSGYFIKLLLEANPRSTLVRR